MKKTLLTFALALFASSAFAVKPFNEVFPANFANGLPDGWALSDNATSQNVAGGLQVNCAQTAPNYRADLKYNMLPKENAENYFELNANKYDIFAITFVGERPKSGVLKLSNIGVDGIGWIKGTEGFSLSESGFTELESNGNYTYYWTIGGAKWTGNLTITKIEVVIADIKNSADNSYIVSKMNWYSSVNALRRDIGLDAEPVVVSNETTEKEYNSLTDAWNAAASGDVLVLNENATVTERLNTNSREITIKGEGHTVSRDNGYNGILFLTIAGKDGDGNKIEGSNVITLENLIIDGVNKETSSQTIEAGNGGTFNLSNLTIINCKTTDTQGVISVKGDGHLNVNSVSFTDCTVPEGYGDIFVGTNSVTLSGVVKSSVYIESDHYITDAGVGESQVAAKGVKNIKVADNDDNKSKVTLLFDTTKRDMSQPIIIGNPDLNYYVSGVNGYTLKTLDAEGNVGATKDTQSSVSEIKAEDNVPVEYFNLQGVKVANPENGLYIMRQGEKVTKVIL